MSIRMYQDVPWFQIPVDHAHLKETNEQIHFKVTISRKACYMTPSLRHDWDVGSVFCLSATVYMLLVVILLCHRSDIQFIQCS
jgi:hypothetical protein